MRKLKHSERVYSFKHGTANLFVNYNPSKSRSIISNFIGILDRYSEPNNLVELFNNLERLSISAWICVNGYEQNNLQNRSKMLINFYLCLSCYLMSLRYLILAFITDETIRIILGDTFIGYSAHSLLNVIFFGATFLLSSIKTALAYSEFISQMKILKVFSQLRKCSFKRSIYGLTRKNDLKFRRVTCLAGHSLDGFILIACGSCLALQALAIVLNPIFSLRTLIFQVLWLPFVNACYYFAGLAAYWFFVHTIIFISLSIQSTSSVIIRVNRLIEGRLPLERSVKDEIFHLNQLQNSHYNTIDILNISFGLSVFISFFFGSFFADLAFFCGTYIGTKNFFIDLLMSFIGFITLGTITEYNFFASGSFKQVT